MNDFQSHRFPVAGYDVLDDTMTRRLLDAVVALPPRCETLLILLDHDRRGRTIVNVDGTCEPDAVFDVAELAVAVARGLPEVDGVILASVRPTGGDELDDIERWLELDQICTDAGVELVEWYVYGSTVSRPRELVGEPDRWAA